MQLHECVCFLVSLKYPYLYIVDILQKDWFTPQFISGIPEFNFSCISFLLILPIFEKKDIVSIFNGVIQLRICNWKYHNRHQLILGISFNKYYKMCRQHFSCRQKSIFFDYVMEKIDSTEKWRLHYYLIKLNWITFWFGIKAGKV